MIKTLAALIFGVVVGCFLKSAVDLNDLSVHSSEALIYELYARHYLSIIIGVSVLVFFHLPYYWQILRWFFHYPKKFMEAASSDVKRISLNLIPKYENPEYAPEKYVPGSEYVNSSEPSFVCRVYGYLDTKYVYLGMAWRCSDYLVTATHVITNHTEIRLQRNERVLDVSQDRFTHYPHDLAAARLSASEWTTLAVSKANVAKYVLDGHQVVSVNSCGKASTGHLESQRSFPHVVYHGSTKSGFSGSPYYCGNTVYAMHLGAGSTNIALDANWISAVVFRNESSEDLLFAEISENFRRTGKRTAYKSFSGDEIYVISNGRTHVLDVENLPEHVWSALEYESPRADKYAGESQEARVLPRVTFDDSSDTCLNIQPVRKSLNLKEASAVAEARRLKAAAPVPSVRLSTLPELSASPDMTRVDMAGQLSMLAQANRALRSTVDTLTRTQKSPKDLKGQSNKPSET